MRAYPFSEDVYEEEVQWALVESLPESELMELATEIVIQEFLDKGFKITFVLKYVPIKFLVSCHMLLGEEKLLELHTKVIGAAR